jgi:hypothetical protein
MRDELEPKLLNVVDDDEGDLVVLLRDWLLGGKQAIELEVLAVGAASGEVDVHACLDPTLGGLFGIHSIASARRSPHNEVDRRD